MTVAELIEKLKTLDQEAIIFMKDYEWDNVDNIVGVSEVEYVESSDGYFTKVPENQPIPIPSESIKRGYWLE